MPDDAPARRATPPQHAEGPAAPLTRAQYRRLMSARAAGADAEVAPSLAESVVSDAAAVAAGMLAGASPAGDTIAVAATTTTEIAVVAPAADRADTETDGPSRTEEPAGIPLFTGPSFVAGSEHITAADDAAGLDEFELAARLFSFTGEMPVRPSAPATAPHAPTRPRPVRPRSVLVGRMAAASFSIGVMTVVGMLAVGATTPAAAVAAAVDPTVGTSATAAAKKVPDSEIQAFVASSAAQPAALERPETYAIESMAQIAASSGVTQVAGTWVNNPSGAVQWPFPVGVPISAGYQDSAYLSQFSSPHRGVDFTPGAGAEIHAVAAGTVRIATEAGADYGVTVVIDHVIDGQPVATRYAHMQYGSLAVAPGDTVAVGQVLGTVGETGKATGPHLHFEVLLNGTTHTDPIPWMYEHTAR